jgi:hypothetical protein
MAIHFEASLTVDLSDHFAISGIAILKPRWGENSRNEKPQNIMWDKHEVTTHSHMGRLKRAMPKGVESICINNRGRQHGFKVPSLTQQVRSTT